MRLPQALVRFRSDGWEGIGSHRESYAVTRGDLNKNEGGLRPPLMGLVNYSLQAYSALRVLMIRTITAMVRIAPTATITQM